MIGIRSLLLSVLSVSALGGLATGGYFLFKPETSENVDTSKNTTENSAPNAGQNNLNRNRTQDQNPGARGASDSGRSDVTDRAQPLSSNPPATPSQGAGGVGDGSVQLPSR